MFRVEDGRTHHLEGVLYSETPSREELLILLHIANALDFNYAHLDGKRAILKAPRVRSPTIYNFMKFLAHYKA